MTKEELKNRIQTLEGYAASAMCDAESRAYFLTRVAELKMEMKIAYRTILA